MRLTPLDPPKSVWIGFYQYGNSYFDDRSLGFPDQIQNVYDYFNSEPYLSHPTVYDGVNNTTRTLNTTSKPFVRIFNTTGILQHNDIGPQYHPTDVGAVKVASHALQYIKLIYGWELQANGPEYVTLLSFAMPDIEFTADNAL